MSALTVEAIKDAINQLPDDDKASFASWLTVQTMDAWDQEMQQDFSPGGRGTAFLKQAKRDAADANVRPLSHGA
jgi:hypothetical protein